MKKNVNFEILDENELNGISGGAGASGSCGRWQTYDTLQPNCLYAQRCPQGDSMTPVSEMPCYFIKSIGGEPNRNVIYLQYVMKVYFPGTAQFEKVSDAEYLLGSEQFRSAFPYVYVPKW